MFDQESGGSHQIVAFSGGKDSTAMVYRLRELGEVFSLLFTPAGNEPGELFTHVERVVSDLRVPLLLPTNHSLEFWVNEFNALPSWRMRWCTRLIKIEPCIAYLKLHPGATLCVGLRADEPLRSGLYGEFATYRYPLREWGWGLAQVRSYLRQRSISVPPRTNCDFCFYQRLSEWYELWRDHPERFAEAKAWEEKTGHSFRSPHRDTWPVLLQDLEKEFMRRKIPAGVKLQHDLFSDEQLESCRVCEL